MTATAVTEPAPGRTRRRLRRGARSAVPSVIQMEAVECGAACLAMVLAFYGCYVPLEVLRIECGVSRDGSNAASLLRAARRYGLQAKGFRMDAKDVAGVRHPVIFWEFQHFMVLEKVSMTRWLPWRRRRRELRFQVNDPASGRRRIAWSEFDISFPGVILTFEPGPDFHPSGRPARLLDGLRERARGTEAALGFVLLISLLLVVPGVAAPAFSRIFIDQILGAGDQSYLPPLLGAIALAAVLIFVFTWMQQQHLLRIETKVALGTSARFFRHLLRLPAEFIAQREPAEVASRLRSNDVVAQILSRDLATSALNLVLVVFYAVLLIRYSVLLAVIGIGLSLLNIVVLRWVSRVRKDAVQRLRADRARLISTSFNSIRIIETIKASGGENDSFQRWAGFQAKVLNSQQKLGLPTAWLSVVPALLATTNTGVILLIGGLQATEGAISIGLLVAFQLLMNSFTQPITQLTSLGERLQIATADMTRLRDVEQYPEAPIFAQSSADLAPITRLDGRLEIRHLSFGYSALKPPLLKDFSLTLQPGRRVALVGPSGSGKSTVGRVVVGLFAPRSGELLFDGLRREQIPREVFASSVAYVDQDVFLFEGTVRENVTLWDDSIPDEYVVRALQDAEIYDVVASRPGSINSLVREGGRNFSGGQRQRLEIARALITQPGLIVLDEAMSALDTATEQRIDDDLAGADVPA